LEIAGSVVNYLKHSDLRPQRETACSRLAIIVALFFAEAE
jgi:hypothetical protein